MPVGRELIEPGWVAPPTITRWPDGAPLEQIRFAGANHLLVDLAYQGSRRLIEPYALRRSRAGNLFVYTIKAQTGEVRAYRADRIEGRPHHKHQLQTALRDRAVRHAHHAVPVGQ